MSSVFYGGFEEDTPGFKKLGILRFSFSCSYQSLILLICIPFFFRLSTYMWSAEKLESSVLYGREYQDF